MEGISQEAIALAGHLKLNKLIVLFDDNGITIDGALSLSDSVDQVKRFEAAGWAATRIDGHDPEAIARGRSPGQSPTAPRSSPAAPPSASARRPRPAPRPTARRSAPTRSPARAKSSAGARPRSRAPPISVTLGAGRARSSAPINRQWRPGFRRCRPPERAPSSSADCVASCRALAGRRPCLKESLAPPKEIATRAASGARSRRWCRRCRRWSAARPTSPAPTTPRPKGMTALSAADYAGRFIHYGVREHGMAAAMNGMALHGGVIPYSGTFLVFSDYCRPAIRLAALMGERVIHVMTHDSIGLGEDGPTHQPVEHLAACARSRTCWCSAPAIRSRRSNAGSSRSKRATARACSRSRARTCRSFAGHDEHNRCALGAYEIVPAEGGKPTSRCSRPARRCRSRSRRASSCASAASPRASSRCRASSC